MDKVNTSVDNYLCTLVCGLSTKSPSYAQEQLVDKITTCGQCEQSWINYQYVDLYSVVDRRKDYKNGKDIKIRVFEGAGDC